MRPDDIVTEAYFDKIQELHPGVEKHDLAPFLVGREPWDRGIQTNWDNEGRFKRSMNENHSELIRILSLIDLDEAKPFRGNHSLIMNWHNLGFIAPISFDDSAQDAPAILVEAMRNPLSPVPAYVPGPGRRS